MLPTVRRERRNVDDPALRNHHHLLHVLMLEMAARSRHCLQTNKLVFSKIPREAEGCS